jgi:hypothetical protein
MDLDAAAFVQYDLSAGVAALGCFDVTFVELAGEDEMPRLSSTFSAPDGAMRRW